MKIVIGRGRRARVVPFNRIDDLFHWLKLRYPFYDAVNDLRRLDSWSDEIARRISKVL